MNKSIKSLIIILLFGNLHSFGQNISFVDINLKNHLTKSNCIDTDLNGTWDAKADLNSDGEISISEAESINSLLLNVNTITDISDMKYFVNLKRLYGNALNHIEKPFDLTPNSKLEILELAINTNSFSLKNFPNLSSCFLSIDQNVKNIYINNNPSLQKMDFRSKFSNPINNLDSIDLSNNNLSSLKLKFPWNRKNYKYLNCNNNKLNVIEIENSDAFDQIILSNNKLTDLSLLNLYIYATEVYFQNNLIENLNLYVGGYATYKLMFSGNPLKSFRLSSSSNLKIDTLDFTSLQNLESIYINSTANINAILLNDIPSVNSISIACQEITNNLNIKNLASLTKLDIRVKNNVYIENLNNYNQNKYIETTKSIYITENNLNTLILSSQVNCKELIIINCNKMNNLVFEPRQLPSVKVQVENNPSLTSFKIISSNDRIDLNVFDCKVLKTIDLNNTQTLSFSYRGINSLQNLLLFFNKGEIELANLPELKNARLPINTNVKLFIHSLQKLDTLKLMGQGVGEVDIFDLPVLKYLDVGLLYDGNNLSCNNLSSVGNLKISNFPLLDKLTINTLCVKDLEIANLPSLEKLALKYINLTDDNNLLSIFNLKKLKNIEIFRANFTKSLFQQLPNLESFSAKYTVSRLGLRLSKLESLKSIDLGWMVAKYLDVQYLPNLNYFYSHTTYSEILNFIDLPKLSKIFCNLDEFSSSSSVIIETKFKKLSSLKRLDFLCRTASLDSLDFSECPKLDSINLDFSGTIPFLNLKNKNEKLSILKPAGFQYSYKSICVDSEAEKVKIKSLLSPNSNATYEFDCESELTKSSLSGTLFFENQDNNIELFKNQYLPIKIIDKGVTYQVLSNNDGRFSFSTQNTNTDITISPQFDPEYFLYQKGDTIVNLSKHEDRDTIDFLFKSIKDYTDVKCSLLPLDRARPGTRVHYVLLLNNIGSAKSMTNFRMKFDSNKMKPSSVHSPGLIFSDNLIELKNVLLEPYSSLKYDVYFDLNTPTDPIPLNGGDLLNFSLNIESDQFDVFLNNNSFELNHEVVNSFDPNEITCAQGKVVYDNTKIKPLKYIIDFENLGSAEALIVVINNTIDTSFLDIKSFRLIDASHSVNTAIFNNKINFNFPDINLSSIKEYNKGYVFYEIIPKKELLVGDIIYNQAEIIFDNNVPILTNLHTLKMEKTTSTVYQRKQELIKLYPNPSYGALNIIVGEVEVDKIEVYNSIGVLHFTLPFNKEIDLSSLRGGLYIIKFLDKDELIATSKVILQD